MVTAVASTAYLMLQKLDPKHRVSRWVKRTSKKWLRMSDKVGTDAVNHARRRYEAHAVFCGHTHQAVHKDVDGVTYVNSGCWTDKPSQYVTIDHDGAITLRDLS